MGGEEESSSSDEGERQTRGKRRSQCTRIDTFLLRPEAIPFFKQLTFCATVGMQVIDS